MNCTCATLRLRVTLTVRWESFLTWKKWVSTLLSWCRCRSLTAMTVGGIILVFSLRWIKLMGQKQCISSSLMLVMRLVWQLFWMWFIIMLQEIIRWLNSIGMVIRLQRIIHTSMWKHLILIACSMISIMKAHWCVSLWSVICNSCWRNIRWMAFVLIWRKGSHKPLALKVQHPITMRVALPS